MSAARYAAVVCGVVAALWAGPLGALGLVLDVAPWYDVAHADTTLGFGTSATYSVGAAPATLFGVSLSPLQRGRLDFAVTWGAVFLRTPTTLHWGPADPKVFARLRLPQGGLPFLGTVEAAARLPLAAEELFPYAFGGQDLEIQAVLALPTLGLHLGGGRILTEPGSNSSLGTNDVPHATHAWALLTGRRGAFAAQVRVDALLFEIKDRARTLFTTRLVRQEPQGFATQLAVKAEAGPDRIYDLAVEIGFAMARR